MRGRAVVWALALVLVAVAGAGALMASASSTSNATVDVGKTGTLGTVLVAANGHTLYRYTVDSKGINRCSNVPACNAYWPALLVKTGSKPTAGSGVTAKLIGTIGAAHGMRQITYAGYPLYLFSGDKSSGQVNGQGFEKKWYAVGANGALVEHNVKAGAANSGGGGGYGYR
jgi:predicted lipoprotein with Yx(FWY)xxD motif